jgi:dTDP-4-dehydrorhamnose reductase
VRILILGSTGILGSFLRHFFKKKNYKIFATGFKQKSEYFLDLLNQKEILNLFKNKKPNVIINCAAQTNVDECVKDFNLAYKSNVTIVKNIVFAIKKLRVKPHFIHFSTDQVYNNESIFKNAEHQVSLTNNYSVTKYLGELEARKFYKSTIIRTNFFGKSFSKNKKTFSEFLIFNLLKKKKIKIPYNIIYNPVSLNYIAQILELMILKKKTGTYNLGAKDSLSKYNFAIALCKNFSLDANLITSYRSKYLKNKRPLNTSVSSKKIEKSLRINSPCIKDMLISSQEFL